ncbi:MAG: hypothetical protein U0R71_04005 [Solirubrobacterales bacterium]
MNSPPFAIASPTPFRLDLTVWALRRREHNEIDRWDGQAYCRTLPIDEGAATVSVEEVRGRSPEASQLHVAIVEGAAGSNAEGQARIALTKLLGLDVDLSGFAAMAASDPALGELAERFRGVRPPRFPTVFEGLVNGIACQQLSLDVGIHLLNRLALACGRSAGDASEGPRAFPRPAELASLDPTRLTSLGFSRAKAEAIVGAARMIVDGALDLEALATLEDGAALESLTSLRGIGRWTAEYVMLRGLGRLHIFPGDDVGARNKLKRFLGLEEELTYEKVQIQTSSWWPYAGVVYFHLLLDSLGQSARSCSRSRGSQ